MGGGISVNEYYYSIDTNKLLEIFMGGEFNESIKVFLGNPVDIICYFNTINKITKLPWHGEFTEENFKNYKAIHISDTCPLIANGSDDDGIFVLEVYGSIYNRVYRMLFALGGDITYEQIYQMLSQAIMDISKEEYENMITLKTTIIK